MGQCAQHPQSEDHRELAFVILYELTETVGEELTAHFDVLQGLFLQALKDPRCGDDLYVCVCVCVCVFFAIERARALAGRSPPCRPPCSVTRESGGTAARAHVFRGVSLNYSYCAVSRQWLRSVSAV